MLSTRQFQASAGGLVWYSKKARYLNKKLYCSRGKRWELWDDHGNDVLWATGRCYNGNISKLNKHMGPLLVVVFFAAVFVFAPLKGALIFCGTILLATVVVQATTSSISKVSVSLTEAFKAIVLSAFFAAVAAFTILSFMVGAPRELINAGSGLGLVALQYGAYVLGFQFALGLTFAHSALVAIVSTLVTSASVWYIAKMASSVS